MDVKPDRRFCEMHADPVVAKSGLKHRQLLGPVTNLSSEASRRSRPKRPFFCAVKEVSLI